MFKTTIDKSAIGRRVMVYTAGRSRFLQPGVNRILYSLDYEDKDREQLAEFSGSHSGIKKSVYPIESGVITPGHIQNVVTLKVLSPVVDAGMLLITLNGVEFSVPVTPGQLSEGSDSAFNAGEIRNFSYAGWDTSGEAEIVVFTQNNADTVQSAPSIENLDITGMVASLTSKSYKNSTEVITFAYGLSSIRDDIVALTRQKGRVTTTKDGISLADRLGFSGGGTKNTITITPNKASIFNLCKLLSAKKARALALNGKGDFSFLTLTDEDQALFDAYYSQAFGSIVSELSLLVSSSNSTDIVITGSFPGTTQTGMTSEIEKYIFSYVMSHFYTDNLQPEIAVLHNTEGVDAISRAKNLCSEQSSSDVLLKNILSDPALKVQQALYPLSEKVFGESSLMTYQDEGDITFSFEHRATPLSSGAIQLLYATVRAILVNGALAKWYTMCGVSDDVNEAKSELEANLANLTYVVNDRMKVLGLFDQLFADAVRKVQRKYLGHQRLMTSDGLTFTETGAEISFERPEWEDSEIAIPGVTSNFKRNLDEKAQDSVYFSILADWFQVAQMFPDAEKAAQDFSDAIGGVSMALSLKHQNQSRNIGWL